MPLCLPASSGAAETEPHILIRVLAELSPQGPRNFLWFCSNFDIRLGERSFSCFCLLSSTSFLSFCLYFYFSSQNMAHISRRLNICHHFPSLSLSISIGSSVSRKPDPEANEIPTPNIRPLEEKQPTSCFYDSRPFPLPWIKPDSPMLSASHPKSIYTGTWVSFLARQEAMGQCPQKQPIAERVGRILSATQGPTAVLSCSDAPPTCMPLAPCVESTYFLTFSPSEVLKRFISLRVTRLKQYSLKCLGLIIYTICAGKGVY